MREIRHFIVALIALVILCIPMEAVAAESASNVCIIDDADLLTDDEYAKLEDYLESLNSDINYMAVTCDNEDYGYNTDDIIDSYFTSVYSNYDDGIGFIIDMYNREIYIVGYGQCQKRISNADAIDITDNVYRFASKGDYYGCISNAFLQADNLVNRGFILRPMKYIISLLLAIVLGFLFTFFFAVLERSQVKFDTNSAQIVMTGATIVGSAAVYDTIRRRHVEASSSGGGFSGGGSSGGSSGGGHSGGGHSF